MARSSDEEVIVTVYEKIEHARAYKSSGNELYKSKEYRNAIGKYHRALLYLKAMPWASSSGSIAGMADLMNVKTKGPTAADLEMKPEADKLSADCYCNIAACMLQQENPNYEKIISHCDNCLGYEPNNLKAMYRKGVAQFHLKVFDSSLETLNSAKELPNGNKDSNIKKYIAMCQTELQNQDKKLKGIYKTMIGAGQ